PYHQLAFVARRRDGRLGAWPLRWPEHRRSRCQHRLLTGEDSEVGAQGDVLRADNAQTAGVVVSDGPREGVPLIRHPGACHQCVIIGREAMRLKVCRTTRARPETETRYYASWLSPRRRSRVWAAATTPSSIVNASSNSSERSLAPETACAISWRSVPAYAASDLSWERLTTIRPSAGSQTPNASLYPPSVKRIVSEMAMDLTSRGFPPLSPRMALVFAKTARSFAVNAL